MKARWKILIIAGVLLALAGASAWMSAHHQPANAVEVYKNTLRARGEKLEVREVVPPPVPVESNGVEVVEEAFKLLTPPQYDYTNLPPMMQMVAPGKAAIGWAQPDLRVTAGADSYTNTWENAVVAAEDNRSAMELLTQAATFPVIQFHLDYQKGPDLLLPHLGPFKIASQRLAIEAMCDLHIGDVPAATTNLCTMLALEQADHDERVVFSQLVRIVVANITAAANWELLQATNLTDGELATLQHGWEQQEYMDAMERACEFERASNDAFIQKLRASKAEYDRVLSGVTGGSAASGGWVSSGDWLEDAKEWGADGFKGVKRGAADYLWRESWSYNDQLRCLQGTQIFLDASRSIQASGSFQPTMGLAITNLERLNNDSLNNGWLTELSGWLGGPLRGIFYDGMGIGANDLRKVLAAEVSRRTVIAAIALKRFQLKHGNFPEQLSDLMPEFLASVPLDPVDGKPLRYQRNADGTFLLYCIGDDGVDEGGDITLRRRATGGRTANWGWQRGHDWVWPQAATAAEIQFFYDNPPK